MKKSPEACVHCGRCITSCPSYRLFLKENYSPRGRNLLLAKDFKSETFDFCLFCENCEKVCPQRLNFPEFYLKKLFQNKSYAFPAISDSLTLLSLHPEGKNFYKRFNPKDFESFKEGDFYLYHSCGLKHLYPKALFIFIEKIKSLGIKPEIPSSQDCCGIIYVSLKAKERLKRFALNKLRLFEKEKPVVTFCATCYWMFKKVYLLLFEGEREEEAFRSLSQRTYFVLDFLRGPLRGELFFKEGKEILYHLPCHLKDSLTFQEKALKKIISKFSETCCGSAKPNLWLKGFQRKYSKIWKRELLGKRYLAVACTGCFLSFGLQIRRPPEIKHWMELLE